MTLLWRHLNKMADEQLNQSKIVKTNKIRPEKKQKIADALQKTEKKLEAKEDNITTEKEETKSEDEKTAKVEKKKKEQKVKKTEASVNVKNLRVSTRHAVAIGKFIKYKKISYAIELLEKVVKKKMAIPFKGEFPHRKGKNLKGQSMMSGKFPVNASKEFIKLLKSLSANSNANGMDLDKTIIFEVIPNKAAKQYHRFGSTEFKRTHILIKSKEIGERKKTGKEIK
jgi:large subunit ribosomal protein L22